MSNLGPVVATVESGALRPAGIVDAAGPLPAVAAFLVVGVVGALVRRHRGDFLDAAVDATVERPLRSPLYGVAACAIGWLAGVYAVGNAFRLHGGLGRVAAALAVGGAVAVVGFGFAVVGTGVAAAAGERRAWAGPLVGAAGSAAVWLALPAWPAVFVCLLVTAAGIGGPVRRWTHASWSGDRAAKT